MKLSTSSMRIFPPGTWTWAGVSSRADQTRAFSPIRPSSVSHAHTQAVGDVLALDATVAFPHVDLRVRPGVPTVLDVGVRGDVLAVSAWCDAPVARATIERHASPRGDRMHVEIARVVGDRRELIVDEDRRVLAGDTRTCLDCEETSCHARPALLRAAR